MTCIRMKPAIFAAFVALLVVDVQAWTSPMRTQSIVRNSLGKSSLSMAEDEKTDNFQLTSGKKEIMFDEKSGRFFETSLETEECIPDEEFCTIDDETGKKIRLTISEKERIFLDSLQVGDIKRSKRTNNLPSFASHTLCSIVVLRQRSTTAPRRRL